MNSLWDIPVEVSLQHYTSSNVCELDAQKQCCSGFNRRKWDIDFRNKTHTRLVSLTDLGPVGMEFCVFDLPLQLASIKFNHEYHY